MRIIDGLKLDADRHGFVKIPDCNRNDLPEFFKEMGFKVGVEIGVEKGVFSHELAKSGAKIYGVDPWKYYDDYQRKGGQERCDFLYEHAKEVLKNDKNVELIRKTSMDAVKDFEDESIDFVYIDGHHGFKFVTEDIFEWSKKVKKGGIISGHDYAFRAGTVKEHSRLIHVKYVINAYKDAFMIPKVYILGSDAKVPGEKRDAYRSWMWVKE